MSALSFSKNNLFFLFIVLSYIFGVMFYDFIEFNYTDELMVLFLVSITFLVLRKRKGWKEAMPLWFIFIVFIFYLIYSLIIESNVKDAIIMDFIIQIKPYLGFICTFLLRPSLSKQQKLFITLMCVSFTLYMVIVGVLGQRDYLFVHPSRFATAVVVTSILYLYCSSFTWRDFLFFILILTVGFFSTRTKFYGFFTLSLFLGLILKSGYKFKISLSSLLILFSIITIVAFVAWDKMYFYFVIGTAGQTIDSWSARSVVYFISPFILIDFFPFGSGFGSFATYASSIHYSDIYVKYHIDNVWGLSKQNPNFIMDAFYPSLVQFGIVGIVLYIYFWKFIYKMTVLYNKIYKRDKLYYISILTICFFAIESIADSTFTHNRGLFILIILGLTVADMKKKVNE